MYRSHTTRLLILLIFACSLIMVLAAPVAIADNGGGELPVNPPIPPASPSGGSTVLIGDVPYEVIEAVLTAGVAVI